MGDFEMFKYVIPKITNLFFAVNQSNYARWCVKYLDNLNKVDETHPGLKNDFTNGCFGIKRNDKLFSRITIDLTLEQTINAEAAGRLSDVSADLQPNRIKIYGKQIADFLEIFEKNINPFDESLDKDSLYKIATAKPVPENVANFLLNIEKNGENLQKQFITECAEDQDRFDKPIKKNQVPNFVDAPKKKKITLDNKVIELRMQRDLFGRLLGRDLSETFLHAQEALNFASDWSKSFKLEFNPDKTRFMAIEKRNVCYDAFQLYLDGTPLTMVKQMKYLGVLLDTKFSWKQHLSYISEKCDKLQRGLNRIARNTFGINFNVHSVIYKQGIEPFILYGSRVWGEALKRKMNSKYLRRIQRRILLRVICGYSTISYDSVYAISGFPPIDITILHDIAFRENLSASSISNYDCILSPFFIPHPSERNAINIVQFSDKSTEDFPVICYTDGSKIDGRVGFAFVVFRSGVESRTFNLEFISDDAQVVVRCSDCDILIILLGNLDHLNASLKLWNQWGVGNHERLISINNLYQDLGISLSKALPCFHAITGCDYIPAFFRKGQLRPFKLLEKSVEYQLACQEIIIEDDDELERTFATLEKFICHMYGGPNSSNVNDVRFYLFSKTYQSKKLDDNFEKNLIHPVYHHVKQDYISIYRECQVIYSQFGLAIHQNDHQARRRFVEWAQNEIAVVPDFHKRILFSDEAHFWLNGYVNKQNCRIWSEANPQVYVETPLHPEKLTVWCTLLAGGILLQKR
ncbi:hypothetical protein TNCV_2221791 [Trichonephila clavipes]|nr:hypothetical protein TNCV_2221791 [Trichonephila clavipes]